MAGTYETRQIDRIDPNAYQIGLKIAASREDGETSGETHWLNISPVQLAAIRAIFEGEEREILANIKLWAKNRTYS